MSPNPDPDLPDRANSSINPLDPLGELLSDYAYSSTVGEAGQVVPDWVTDRFVRVVGYSIAELEAHGGWRSIIHPEDLPIVEEHIGQLLANRPSISEFRILSRAGETRWIRDTAKPLWDTKQKRVGRIYGAAQDLTERKRADDAARLADERYRHLIDHATDVIYNCDVNGCFTFINRTAAKLMKYSEQELIGRHFLSLIRADYRDQAGAYYARQILEKIPSTYFEFPAIAKDGTEIWFGQNVQMMVEGDRVVGVQAIARDITRQKAAEEALRASEARFRTMAETSPLGIFLADPQGMTIYSNPAALRATGLTSAQAMGLGWREALRESDRERALERWRGVVATKGSYESLSRYVHKDGREVLARVRAVPMYDGPTLLGYLGVIEDTTEAHAANRALKASEEKYRGLFENIQEGVFQTTPDGKVVTVNQAFVQTLGYDSPDEVLALDITRDVYDDPEMRIAFWELLHRDGVAKNVEIDLKQKNGQRISALVSGRLVRGADGEVLYCEGAFIDITERRRLEAQLRQAQKMESIGRLAGGVAHDFNNLLTAILGYAEFTADYLPVDHPGRANLDQVMHAAHRASDLTRQLLAFARRQMIEPRVINLNELVTRAEQILRRVISEDIELIARLTEPLGGARVDPGQFEQILMNLAVNARDAMPHGGRLIIETGEVTLDPEYAARNPGMVPGPHVLLAVSDTGTGMTDEIRAHIFEPFFTTKEPGKGTGLGLATVYGIVKQAGGYIQVESQAGTGTTFRIYLPRTEERAISLQASAPPDVRQADAHETILLVEVDPLVREIAAESLRGLGYMMLVADNSLAALDVARRQKSIINLLITDVVMAAMSGTRLAEELRVDRPELKVLYLSGYSDEAILHQTVTEEGVAFLPKPFTPAALAEKVGQVLSSSHRSN